MNNLYICDGADVNSAAEICRSGGWGIEVQAFYDPAVAEEQEQIEQHKRVVAGIPRVSLHGPFGDLCAGSFDAMVRQVARHRFEQAYAIAGQIGATDVILHHGYVPGTSQPDNWLRRFADFWADFSEGKSPRVKYHLENMLERGPEVMVDLLSTIEQDNVDACLDVGHAFCNSTTAVTRWVEALGDLIGYVHLHDNNGEGDEHLALGEGQIPLPDVCDSLREHAPRAIWALECEPQGRTESIQWLGEHGYLDRCPAGQDEGPAPADG